ncbi:MULTISPECIES: pyridoxine 5'-phosphate synthase [Elizabethkingia]|uniref:Pyridoxine 5'-phosphate synthase n=1 Tax=Elizabethkingia anophelis TaxID=1117645 RepID=A0A494J433_9FLAO|nr:MULTISPECIES: pyridoxine 5'-phosphate synthase [Elizabethkingia]AQW91399.1 pyridoxine 5'-phosphate synthase [Elizabethkingia anophelis]AQX49181.1 pyridoxine 5'-phosphate synthase [Elizabethkingia anophelis]ELB0068947.1 pyridoxine 5'-phosphate synthase [Elizabethkingia anophelis]ELB0070455.1 pyridoxine 5'-phosphate synthase [Elizabethkingia anophelis]ELB1894033.1 pyridoxine 5'-phosphate synthase [Elizabethkingia anophelis]
MTKLSVNINKIATLRNARGGDVPSVTQIAIDAQKFGAQGITIHPRPDERHITRKDVYDLKPLVTTEFNIEGNPHRSFIDMVLDVKPEQVTLVPDADDAITSNAGWDCKTHLDKLTDIIAEFKNAGIRTSIFLDPDPAMVEYAAKTGTDRIELYTEAYATNYPKDKDAAIKPYYETALRATEFGLGINAGHDLSLDNLKFFADKIPNLLEVSIGHALISEALYLGLENTIQSYLKRLAQW